MLKNCVALAMAWLACLGYATAATSNDFALADSPYIIRKWPPGPGEQNLPSSVVLSIVQSKEGYLWLATLNGLVRFDGLRFKVFDEADVPGLNSRRIVYLFEDSRTNLWVGTEADGIVVIKKDGSIQNLNLGSAASLAFATEDSGGTIWLLASNGQLSRYRDGRLEATSVHSKTLMTEKSGRLVLGTDTALFAQISRTADAYVQILPISRRLDFLLPSRNDGYWILADGRIQKLKDGKRERDLGLYPWGNARVMSACEDPEGNLIVGTEDAGVFWFDAEGRTNQITSAQGLSHGTALSLYVDREGDLWVGTNGGGLNRVKHKHFRVLKVSEQSHPHQSLVLNIRSVCEDGQGGLWFANPYWRLFSLKAGTLKAYGAAEGLREMNLLSVNVDHARTVWVGTPRGLFALPEGADSFQLISRSEFAGLISAIYPDRSNRLWVGTQVGLWCREDQSWKTYTTADGLTTNDVRAIAEDKEGNLWVGTQRGGLNCLRAGKFTSFRKSDQGLPSDNVSALWADADGVLWVGTSAGLVRLQNGNWTRYTTQQGLANNGIGSLIEDHQGDLWVGSYAGIMRLTKKSLNDFARDPTNAIVCRVYGEADGLPASECAQDSQPASCITPDGRLWFATINGLVSVQPAELKPNQIRPPVIIEKAIVEGVQQNTNNPFAKRIESITVPPGKEHLDIHYTSLNLGAADRAQFKYWLEGYEKTWTSAGARRVVPYSNLSPGEYRFHVKACNEDGVWSEPGAILMINVLPPFWRHGWFIALMVACLIALIAGIVYFFSTQKLQRQLAILKQQEALERERARIARDLHDQLGANLTQVALLGELAETDKAEPVEVESHARQISQTARETTKALDEIVWAVNPSNDTLDGLITYVCKYAQEYFELAGLRYRLEVPPKLPDATVPPEVRHNVFLAAKEAINNVVKHAQASGAWLRLRLDADRFVLEIEDNGRGLAGMDEKTGRNGLRNMRKRLEDVGGSFSIDPAPEHGTIVRLAAPIGNH
jgi:ligand-binding sensor domain-containing protein/signal transduction histidine kinase